MIIEEIHLENFRSLKDVTINCDNLIAIIGKNGSGKSSVLYALDAFYNVSAQFTEYDYFARDTNAEIKIRITYGELRDDEKEEFEPYLKGGKLIVTKKITTGGAKYYGASKQLREFYEIRKEAATPKRTKFNELVASGTHEGLNSKARNAAEVDAAMAQYEATHPELLEIFETPQQFFGPRNIGGGKLDKFTKFVLIPAVRDASAETERKGVILQLIDVLVSRSVSKRPDVQQLNEEFERRVSEVYSLDNLQEIGQLAGMITKLLAQYAPGAELDLAFDDIPLPKINLPPAVASLVEDNFKCPISYTGHGLQRALIFALMQQLTLTDMSPETDDSLEQGKDIEAAHVPDLILAIEEPELYLHPARSRYLSGVMAKLSSRSEDEEAPRTQIFYATHSPYFIDLNRFDRIRLARKCAIEGYDVLESRISQYSKQEAAEQLAAVSGRRLEEFTKSSFVAHAASVMTSIVNEGFFADVVVVVEGLSDASILWAVQQQWNKSWDGLNIVIVPAGGKNNIDRPVLAFRGFGIPTYFVFDGDSSHTGTDRETKSIKSNEILLNLAKEEVVDFPETQIHETWAVFNDKIEMELKVAAGGELFERARAQVADDLGYKPSNALKNPEAAARFIDIIYSKGKKVKVIDEIVEKVSNLKRVIVRES